MGGQLAQELPVPVPLAGAVHVRNGVLGQAGEELPHLGAELSGAGPEGAGPEGAEPRGGGACGRGGVWGETWGL